MEEYGWRMRQAAGKYCYPAKTYDFMGETESEHSGMSCVERLIREQLVSDDRSQVKDGLSNVLYWGYVRQGGIGLHRMRRLRQKVTDDQLDAFMECRRRSAGIGIEELHRLRLPQFSGMSFSSKVLMFMRPDRYPVLDLKIARFARREPAPSLDRPSGLSALLNLKLYPTRIPLTESNMRAYREWAGWCRAIADDVSLRAVDVERAIFWCIDQERETEARRLLLGPK